MATGKPFSAHPVATSSAQAQKRPRSPLSTRRESHKRIRLDDSPTTSNLQHVCKLAECARYEKKMDGATNIALDYLFALDSAHQLFRHNLKQILSWVGNDTRIGDGSQDTIGHAISHVVQKGKALNDEAKQAEIITHLLNGWAQGHLRQMATLLESHMGYNFSTGNASFTAWERSERYKLEFKVTPLHRIVDSEAKENEQEEEEDDDDDDDSSEDSTDEETDREDSGLVVENDGLSRGQHSGGISCTNLQPRVPSTLPADSRIVGFRPVKSPEKQLLFQMPVFSKRERKSHQCISDWGREIADDVGNSLDLSTEDMVVEL